MNVVWPSEGVAPQFTNPSFFPLEEMAGYCYIIGMLVLLHGHLLECVIKLLEAWVYNESQSIGECLTSDHNHFPSPNTL